MKKIALLVAVCSTLGSAAGFADQPQSTSKMPPCKANQEFAWGTALTSLAVIGVVVGLTAGCAAGN